MEVDAETHKPDEAPDLSADSSAEEEEKPDPLYDPDADDADTSWADGKRRGRVSDAILSCPCCFTTLCIDCQRHETKPDQYRAMFVTNCNVKQDKGKSLASNARRRGRKRQAVELAHDEVVYPVHCDVCDIEVGVQDSDEIYHFFNIVPSNA